MFVFNVIFLFIMIVVVGRGTFKNTGDKFEYSLKDLEQNFINSTAARAEVYKVCYESTDFIDEDQVLGVIKQLLSPVLSVVSLEEFNAAFIKKYGRLHPDAKEL